MEAGAIGAFVAASALLIIVPGVDMALVTRQVIAYGRRSAFATIAGLLTGIVTHISLAAIGLSALLTTSATAYMMVKYVGAAYLVAIGIQTLWATRSGAESSDQLAASTGGARQRSSMSWRRAYLLGLTSNLTNPKVAVFFLTFFPQFVSPGPEAARQTVLLGLLFVAMSIVWLISFALALGRLSGWLSRSAVRRRIQQATGAVLIAFGVRLAVQR